MLVKVWKEASEAAQVVYLGMDSACATGLVRIVAKNEEGNTKSVLAYIGPEGIMRAVDVPPKLGFKMDEHGGRIVLKSDPLLKQIARLEQKCCPHCGHKEEGCE